MENAFEDGSFPFLFCFELLKKIGQTFVVLESSSFIFILF